MYDGFHLDTTIATLGYNSSAKKYILLANPVFSNPTNIPAIFRGKNWVVLNSPNMVDNGFEPKFDVASIWIGLNILVINPSLVLIDSNQKHLIEVLEFYGI